MVESRSGYMFAHCKTLLTFLYLQKFHDKIEGANISEKF